MRRASTCITLLVSLAVAVATAHAGQQSKVSKRATLSGTVIGPDDKPVPHAAITYQSSGGNAPHATHADARGHFTIGNLRRDIYDIRASAHGIFSEWEKNVVVRPGQQKTITLQLIYAKEMPKTVGTPVKKKE
jgi:hypothetical protein